MGNDKGFTLIEIVAVLVVLGVVSAILVAGNLGSDTERRASADMLKVHLRYAQSRSMNGDLPWGVRFDGSSYTLVRDISGTPSDVLFPGENSLSMDLPDLVAGTVGFDTWGRPSGLSTISLGSQVVTITPDTGFIP
ncbi:MAG: prepilin-type N-terminal cleavage/methylation domain-containing protein [Proteobacteria bacterium]|nr:prepilin-type N-terminal cleavage/methylation domain-containing protein [Pseudomonadota bacterium]